MPPAVTLMRTAPSPASGVGTSVSSMTSGPPKAAIWIALTCPSPLVRRGDAEPAQGPLPVRRVADDPVVERRQVDVRALVRPGVGVGDIGDRAQDAAHQLVVELTAAAGPHAGAGVAPARRALA